MHMQPCPSARTGVASARESDPGGESPGLHKPGFRNFFLENFSRARKVGETRSEPLRARGAAPLSNGFEFRFCERDCYPHGPRPERGSVSAEAKREAE